MKETTLQEKEDMLRTMYGLRRAGDRVARGDIICRLGMSGKRLARIIDALEEEGMCWKDEKGALYLTRAGFREGRACAARHEDIVKLLRLVAGAGRELAEEKACVIEHELGREICEGIHSFLDRKHLYSYSVEGGALGVLYGAGEREMPCAIYVKGTRSPRILAGEHALFENRVLARIGRESTLSLYPKDKGLLEKELLCLAGGAWRAAAKEGGAFVIPDAAVTCTVRPDGEISEGKAFFSLQDAPGSVPGEGEVRVLAISLI